MYSQEVLTHPHDPGQESQRPALKTLFPHVHVPPPQILHLWVVAPRSHGPFEPHFRDVDEPRRGDLVFHVDNLHKRLSELFAGSHGEFALVLPHRSGRY